MVLSKYHMLFCDAKSLQLHVITPAGCYVMGEVLGTILNMFRIEIIALLFVFQVLSEPGAGKQIFMLDCQIKANDLPRLSGR